MGFSGDNRAPSPATTSTLPVVVVMLKNESILVVFFVVILDGGIVDFGNRTSSDKGINDVGGELLVGDEHFLLTQQSS